MSDDLRTKIAVGRRRGDSPVIISINCTLPRRMWVNPPQVHRYITEWERDV